MKYRICAVCLVCLWFLQCNTEKKVGYAFPASMNETDRAKFTRICDKGQVLYAMNCSGCHNVQAKRKSIIPDFTQDQMSRYELKANNMQHDTSKTFTSVTPEEMSNIYLFLTYKEKSNIPLVLPAH